MLKFSHENLAATAIGAAHLRSALMTATPAIIFRTSARRCGHASRTLCNSRSFRTICAKFDAEFFAGVAQLPGAPCVGSPALRTVDPVVAGSSPVALVEVSAPAPRLVLDFDKHRVVMKLLQNRGYSEAASPPR